MSLVCGVVMVRRNGVLIMFKIEIEIPEAIVITSRGQEVELELSKLGADLLARGLVHGFTQKVADAASQATKDAKDENEVAANTLAMMQKAVDGLIGGEWGRTRGASGVDEFTSVARSVARSAVKAAWGAKSPKWTEFTGLADAEQAAKLDTVYADNEATFKPVVEAKLAERKAERERKAKLAKGVEINI